MSDIAVRASGLGKRYTIGRAAPYARFSEMLVHLAKAPFRAVSGGGGSDHIWALKDVNLEIQRGEAVGIIGRNGAGKSTLLKILSRITEPTEGEARVRGRVGSLLEVGTGFHPELTGRENIYLNGAILGMTRDEIRGKFDAIVAFADIDQFLDTPVKRYSSGMYMRLAFAIAAHLEPEVLVFDEVLAVGDAAFQKKCLGKMDDVARSGRTILFVSHNMTAIENLCRRVYVFDGGRITYEGEPAAAIQHYLTSTTDRSESGVVELVNVPGRSRESRPVFQRVELPQRIEVGQDVVLHMTLDTIADASFNIAVHSDNGQCVCKFKSELMTEPFQIEGPRTIELHWPNCPLAPGSYYVNLMVKSNLAIVDRIEEATRFTVAESDVYRTGQFDTNPGLIIPYGTWRVT